MLAAKLLISCFDLSDSWSEVKNEIYEYVAKVSNFFQRAI